MESMGLWMLVTLGVILIATGLPAWIVLIGVAMAFALGGVIAGAVEPSWLGAMPGRLLGLLENDLLQALPLYVFMGALLNRLPLARMLFRAGCAALKRTPAAAPLAGLSLGVLLAPMNGSVGASVATLSRTVQPQLDAGGLPVERSAALVCVASTLGVVIPPSLVLILLGDAMMRAHTEALNLTRESVRIINTQDVFAGALVPAGVLLVLCLAITWWNYRREPMGRGAPATSSTRMEQVTAAFAALFIVGLLASVTLGYLYAVEAAAAGGVALFLYGLATRTLTRSILGDVLRDTMAITGALFALLVAATVFTLIVRAYGTDRWIAALLTGIGGEYRVLVLVLAVLAACALVLDAFEMIFVVIPVVMPPLLTQVHNTTWVAVLALLILQASFLAPPFGYAVLMVRNRMKRPLRMRKLSAALLPYLFAQVCVLTLVFAFPSLVWQRNPTALTPAGTGNARSEEEGREMMERQLQQQESEQREEAQPVK